jgi:tRNA A37 methylthiotransferase MiaB
MSNTIAPKERLALVQKTIDKSTEKISKAMIGSVQKVLVENKEKDKQRSTKHTYKTKDRITRTQLKTWGELRWSGSVSS